MNSTRASSAQYLLRVDDLTPGITAEAWPALLSLIERHRLQPILAIVPDSRDPLIGIDRPNPVFWSQMRSLQSAGASIALHGFRHLCLAHGRSLVPLHRTSEFCGLSQQQQQDWIRQGIRILRTQELKPTVWVAPRHGIDRATLRALRQHGITTISDGFARQPYRAYGCVWIPQQLWEPVLQPFGLWTICLHPGSITSDLLHRLDSFFTERNEQFTSVDRVLRQSRIKTKSIADRLFMLRFLARYHLRHHSVQCEVSNRE